MARRRKQREFNPISLAFLDVMSCGFGAVVLIFLILDHNSSEQNRVTDAAPAAEINRLQEEVREGEEGLVRARNTLSQVDLQIVEAQGRARTVQEEIDSFLEELARLEADTLAREESIDDLRSDIATLEEEVRRLRAAEEQQTGSDVREFVGEGNRQYLTGLLMGGNRILILVDKSASMLDDTIVNIIRRRNMDDNAKLRSEKWTRVRNTVDWLTAQLPAPSRYQIYTFNNEVQALLPESEGRWLEAADQEELEHTVSLLDAVVPAEGTNLENLFRAIQSFDPLPDNIYLITDGLPTLGSGSPAGNTIAGRERERLFERSLEALPRGIPVNVILAPLEGDPMAAAAYWKLAMATGGSFLSPSDDWP